MKSEGPVILAAFANDHSDQARFLRNLSTEAQRIQKVLEPAQDLCPLVLLPGAKLEDILDAFQKYRDRVVVFHYAGHANGFQLLLESASGGVHRIGAKGLASFLGQQQGLQLVFLNGCSTERQAEDLLVAGVGCVIATTQAIDDAVATDFSARFYKGIVTGAPLQAAYSEAVGAAQAFSGGSVDRLLVPLEGEEEVPHETGRWPWLLKLRPGAERVAQWSLPEAAGDPLFGLPPVKPRDLPESPYRHLYRFEEQHAEVFFGRGHEIRELYQRVTAPDSPPVVLFYGPAGVGKSSLLDAGLIPRLEGKNEVRYERREPTLGLGNSLRLAFPMEFRKLSRRDAWIEAEKKLGRPLVIVLDQVEEAFTKPNPQQPHELEEFAQLLRRIFFSAQTRPQGRLILGFRKEWFAEIDERLADAQVPRSRIFLERLCRDGAIEAITGPVDDPRLASHYKLTVEAGLPEVIADDLLADPDTPVAPTLQILLTRMWSEACRRNREKPTFDAELYQSLHRDGILLDDFLKQQTEQIRSQLPQAVDSGFLLDLLEFHTTAIGTSAEHPVSLLEQTYSEQSKSGLLGKALKLCEEAYLLTFSSQPSDDGKVHRSSRLLHDTLAPLIRARHEESDLPGQRARRILDNRVVDWMDGKAGIPLDAKDLKEVETALEGTRDWTVDEERLITASRNLRSSTRRWRHFFQSLGVVAAVAVGASGWLAFSANKDKVLLNTSIRDLQGQQASLQAEKQRLTTESQSLQAEKAILVGEKDLLTKDKADLVKDKNSLQADITRASKELQSSTHQYLLTQTATERQRAAISRSVDEDYFTAAHQYAAAAFQAKSAKAYLNIDDANYQKQIALAERSERALRFSAERSIHGVRLASILEPVDSPTEVWRLENGRWIGFDGRIGRVRVWNSDGMNEEDLPVSAPAQVLIHPERNQVELVGIRQVSPVGDQKTVENSSIEFRAWPTTDSTIEGLHWSRNQPDRLVFWTASQVSFLELGKEVVLTISEPGVTGARFSPNARRALTWKKSEKVKLWEHQDDGVWKFTELKETNVDSLPPDFLSDEHCVIWDLRKEEATETRQFGSNGGNSAKTIVVDSITGESFNSSGQSAFKLFPESAPEVGERLMGWTHAPAQLPLGHTICLWTKEPSRATVCWCPANANASETAFRSIDFSEPISGATISSDGLHIAVRAGNEVHLLSGGPPGEKPQAARRLLHTESVREALFSSDNRSLLTWTARHREPGLSNFSSDNVPGTIRVWETSTGIPRTIPWKAGSPIEHCRFIGHDEVVVTSQNGQLSHWQLTSQLSQELTVESNKLMSPDQDENFISIPKQRLVDGKPVMEITMRPRESVMHSLEFESQDRPLSLQFGNLGGGGGGFAIVTDNRRNLQTPLRHPTRVKAAEWLKKRDMLLTWTMPTSDTKRVTVHLWDTGSLSEVMEPLNVDNKFCRVKYNEETDAIEILGLEETHPLGFSYSIAPTLPDTDLRSVVVERTGTFLNEFGELSQLTKSELHGFRKTVSKEGYDASVERIHKERRKP